MRKRTIVAGVVWLATSALALAQSQTLLPAIIPQIPANAPVVHPCRLVQSSLQGQIVTNCMTGLGGGGGGSLAVTDGTTTIADVTQIAFMGGTVGGMSPNAIVDVSAGGGTSSDFGIPFPSIGTAAGAEYLSSPPTLSTGQMVPFFVDVNGNLKVNVVSGGGSGGTSSNFGAAFPASGTASGGEYLASPPTLTAGQMAALQTDVNGNLKVNIVTGAGSGGTAAADNAGFTYGTTLLTPVGGVYNSSITALTSGSAGALALTSDRNAFVNVNRWAGVALGAPSNYGTSPGAVEVHGVNAFVTNSPAVTQSGTWTVQPGNTPNSTPWLMTGSGSAGTAAPGVVSVQGVASMTPVQVSQATASNLKATVVVASGDACIAQTHHFVAINQTGSAQYITGTSSKKTYICSINLVVAGAENLALVEGTGSVCGTNTFGMAGGVTAAAGWNFVANGGLTLGGGSGVALGAPDADANATAANVCLLESGSDQVSGQITYVQQ